MSIDLKMLSAAEIGELCLPYESFEDICASLSWSKMDSDWKDRLVARENGWWLKDIDCLPDDPQLLAQVPLRDVLLSIGGESVCMYYEEDLDRIMERGILWSGVDTVMMPGRPSHCHGNSAYCWDANRDKVTIATGYAMSYSGGMWRQHSWCVGLDDPDRGPYIIETTEPRIAYYGFPMTYDECEVFLYQND